MRHLPLVALALSLAAPLAAQRPNTLSFEEGEEGWFLLFYGASLDGWTAVGEAAWEAVGGEIRVAEAGPGLLVSMETVRDFELKADFLAAPGAEGGILLRGPERPSGPGDGDVVVAIGPPGASHPTGSLVGLVRVEGVEERDEWRTLHVELIGRHLEVRLDDELLVEHELPEARPEGRIALVRHSGELAFRDVKLRWLN